MIGNSKIVDQENEDPNHKDDHDHDDEGNNHEQEFKNQDYE